MAGCTTAIRLPDPMRPHRGYSLPSFDLFQPREHSSGHEPYGLMRHLNCIDCFNAKVAFGASDPIGDEDNHAKRPIDEYSALGPITRSLDDNPTER